MNKKIISIMLAVSLSLAPLATMHAENHHHKQKDSTARRVGFFLLHSACTLGGIYATINGGLIAPASAVARNASPATLQEAKNTAINNYVRQGHTFANANRLAEKSIDILRHPATLPVAATAAIGGLAMTIYGVQGLFKDLKSLFN